MKKALIALLLICTLTISANAEISAQSAVLIDGRCGFALYEKEADRELPMASTTKIMTSLLTLEAAEVFDEAVVISPEALTEGSSMGLRAGWQVRLSALAAGMLLASGNDAANAAALSLGGSFENFAEMMNTRAEALGLCHTHFVTPSGLDDPLHYSSARDLALLAAEAMKNPSFAALAGTREKSVEILSPAMTLRFENHNKLLRICEGCIGVKTGYTKRAGRCLVSCAEREGVRLFAVTLNDPDDWNDHIALYEMGFSALEERTLAADELNLTVIGGKKDRAAVSFETVRAKLFAGEEPRLELYCPALLYAPLKKGACVGEAVWRLGEETLACLPLTLCEDCEAQSTQEENIFTKILHFFGL